MTQTSTRQLKLGAILADPPSPQSVRREYEHKTLRGHLGLPIPTHRHARPLAIAAE